MASVIRGNDNFDSAGPFGAVEFLGEYTSAGTQFDVPLGNSAIFKSYRMEFLNIRSTSDASFRMRMGPDAAFSNLGRWETAGTKIETSTSVAGIRASGLNYVQLTGAIRSAGVEPGASGVVDIVGPHTAKATTLHFQSVFSNTDSKGSCYNANSYHDLEQSMTHLRFFPSGGSFTGGGVIRLYGYK